MKRKIVCLLALCGSAIDAPWAQEQPGNDPHQRAEDHEHQIEELVVTAHPLSAAGMAQPFQQIDGKELERKLAPSIGATLAGELGVHSTSFGPAVGRPVIHGLAGARVRVAEDHIGTMDVSVTSGDHAVAVDPFIADEILILKGASTLLYGPGAIGGVVDVHTGRVPQGIQQDLTGKLTLQGADNGDATSGAFRLDGGTDTFAWHLDAFTADADDVDIPGFLESGRLRALEGEDRHEEGDDQDDGHEEDEEVRGVLPGSYRKSDGGAVGVSMIDQRGLIGVAVSRLEMEYGLPGHGHGEEDEHEEEAEQDEADGQAYIDLERTRLDFEAALLDPFPGVHGLHLRIGVNDYKHTEIEPSGKPGTVFKNDAWEALAQFDHFAWLGWNGVFGFQLSGRDYRAFGEEANTPPVETFRWGAFWVGERDFSDFQLESGLRIDQVKHDPATGSQQKFNGVSVSLGAVIPFADGWTATALVDYATRAPAAEELFSSGPHFAIESFELGNPDLDEETALNFSASLGYEDDRWSAMATAYFTEFSDFIHLADQGGQMGELPVREHVQKDASFAGFEVEASAVVAAWSGGGLNLRAFFDTVSAQIDGGEEDNPPRLPPERLGLGATLTDGPLTATLDYVRTFRQNEIAPYELVTDGYDDLRAHLSWDVEIEDAAISLFIQGRNLTDDEQRHHTSFAKDVAPAPGRTIEAGLRLRF